MARYTKAELDEAALADLKSDMAGALKQAAEGPYYPERFITAESLRAYAEKCRLMIERHADGGAHDAILTKE